MQWTPEIFAAFVTAGGGALYALKRIGWLTLPLTRNSKPDTAPKPEPAPVIHEARPECLAKHEELRSSVDQLESDRTELKTMSGQHEKRIDKQDEKFEKIIDGIGELKATIRGLTGEMRRRNGTT